MKLPSTLLASVLLCAPALAVGAPERQAQVNVENAKHGGSSKLTRRAMLKNATQWQYNPAVRRSTPFWRVGQGRVWGRRGGI